jgi:hypothetical protein
MTRSLAVALNALGLYAIALVLAAAFAAQLLLDELPCPLCLLQRIQFALLAVGPILNVRFGPRPSHTRRHAGRRRRHGRRHRQILLHIMPGDPAMARRCSGIPATGPSSALRWPSSRSRHAAFDRQFEDDAQQVAAGVRAHRRVAGDRPHRAQRDLDIAGMRVCRLPRQSGRLHLLKHMR